jgi:hypothetical protein
MFLVLSPFVLFQPAVVQIALSLHVRLPRSIHYRYEWELVRAVVSLCVVLRCS